MYNRAMQNRKLNTVKLGQASVMSRKPVSKGHSGIKNNIPSSVTVPLYGLSHLHILISLLRCFIPLTSSQSSFSLPLLLLLLLPFLASMIIIKADTSSSEWRISRDLKTFKCHGI